MGQKIPQSKERESMAKVNLNGIDKEVVEYIRKLRFRKKFYGADEEQLWVVVSNIQKYYEKKVQMQKIRYEQALRDIEAGYGRK